MPRKRLTRADKVKRELKAAQASLGMTQNDIAKVFGVSQAVVSEWFSDFDKLKHGRARRLVKLLGLDMNTLDAIE